MKLRMLLLVVIILIGCGKKVESESTGRQSFFMQLYNEKWGDYSIKDVKLKKQVSKLLSSNDFKVIWNWDTDADGIIEYFCVLMDNTIKKAITKGVLIDLNGKIKLVFDVNKGIYTKKYYVYDFKKMGIKQNEVKCIRLLFKNVEMKCDKDEIERESKPLSLGQKLTLHDGFGIQLVSHKEQLFGMSTRKKYLKLLKYEMFQIDKSILVRPLTIKYSIMNPMGDDEKLIYKGFRKMVQVYRTNAYKMKVYNE